jgi:S1-C subfamily serine protease
MVKEFLSQRGVRYEERDVSVNAVYARELRNSGQTGVPVTMINNQMVVGFDRATLERIIAQGQAGQRPSFGAMVADAARITAKMSGGSVSGAFVGKVKPGSAAEKLGLAPGDIIVELNASNIANAAELENALSGLGKGSRLSLVYLRDNRRVAAEGTY